MMKTEAGSFNEYAADIFAQLSQARCPALCQISYFNYSYPFSILQNPLIDQIRMLFSVWILRTVLLCWLVNCFYFMAAMDQRLQITNISMVKKTWYSHNDHIRHIDLFQSISGRASGTLSAIVTSKTIYGRLLNKFININKRR